MHLSVIWGTNFSVAQLVRENYWWLAVARNSVLVSGTNIIIIIGYYRPRLYSVREGHGGAASISNESVTFNSRTFGGVVMEKDNDKGLSRVFARMMFRSRKKFRWNWLHK